MDISKFVAYSRLLESPEDIMDLVDEKGEVIIIKDDEPLYVIQNINQREIKEERSEFQKPVENITLHVAMERVLSQVDGHTLHAAELADEIYNQKLYFKKNGEKANAVQIRARAGRYQDKFEALSGNLIKLRKMDRD